MSSTRRNILLTLWIALILAAVLWAKFFHGQGALSKSTLWEQDTKMGLEAMQERRLQDADTHFAAALRRAEPFGPADIRLGTSVLNLAELRKEQAKFAESETLFQRALTILDPNGTANTRFIAQVLNDYATVCVALNKFKEARDLMKRSVSISEKTLNPNDPELAADLRVYGAVLLALNEVNEAAIIANRASAIEARNGTTTAPAR